MVNSVTFLSSVGGDGSTVTDDSNPTTGLGNGGHRIRLVPSFSNIVNIAQNVVNNALSAAASAATALNAPGTSATSTTSNDITGAVGTDKTFTIQTGKSLVPGMAVIMARTSAPATQALVGVVKTYNSGTGSIVISVGSITGTGTSITDWTLSLTATVAGSVGTSRTISAAGLATGGGTLAADRTITVTAATGAQNAAGSLSNVALTPASYAASLSPQTLTDGATVNWDMGQSLVAKLTLAGNRTLAKPTNYRVGETWQLWVVQDGTGGRTLAFNTCYKWGAKGTQSLSSAAGTLDLISVTCLDADGTNPIFRLSIDKG